MINNNNIKLLFSSYRSYHRVLILLILIFCIDACKNEKANDSATIVSAGDPKIDKISASIALQPKNDSLFVARAKAYYEANSFDQAIADMAKAMAIDTANIKYHHLLADIYMDYPDSRMALRTMERITKLHPESVLSQLKLSEFQLILKNYQGSMNTLNTILKQHPQEADAYLMMGLNFKEMGDTARAIKSFKTATEMNPYLVDAWHNIGSIYDAQKNPKALQYFDAALRIDSTSIEILHAKALYYQHQNKFKDALKIYRHINILSPQYPDAYFNAGLLYLDMDSIPQAHRNFDYSVKVSPIYVQGYYYRGLTYEKMTNFKAAKQDYQQAMTLSPNFKEAKEAFERLKDK